MPQESDDKKDVPFDAPWVGHMRHRLDPNRVDDRQIPSPGRFNSRPSDQITPATQTDDPGAVVSLSNPQSADGEPSYYDVPILQQPVWKWQIATYFFLGGLSAGAYVAGRAARRAGGPRFEHLARAASAVALAGILPCPGLLIWDLGDPKRFHHMLRVWKPSSPMNLGSWMITLFGAHAAFDALQHYINSKGETLRAADRGRLRKLMNNGTLMLIHDAAGLPLALFVASYTGVLLSCTSNPLWCKNPWLAPLFTSSALSTGAEAVSLAMDWRDMDPNGQSVLRRLDTAAHAAELIAMRGFMEHAGEKTDPLRHGRARRYHHFGTGAIVAAEALKLVPLPQRLHKPRRIFSMALGLAGGLAMRWAMVFGGHEAAADPHLSRAVSRPPKADPPRQISTRPEKVLRQSLTKQDLRTSG